jgi:hypothetical protein
VEFATVSGANNWAMKERSRYYDANATNRASISPAIRSGTILDHSLRRHYFSFFRREARWRRPSAVM